MQEDSVNNVTTTIVIHNWIIYYVEIVFFDNLLFPNNKPICVDFSVTNNINVTLNEYKIDMENIGKHDYSILL